MMVLPKFLLLGAVLISAVSANPKPDVSELLQAPGSGYPRSVAPLPSFYGQPLSEGWAAKTPKCQYNGECIEAVNNLEYRPFITYNEQYYSVLDPDVTFKKVHDPKVQEVTMEVPRVKEVLVPIRHVKQIPKRRTLKKIKETVEPVYINNHEVSVERVSLKDPFVISQPVIVNTVNRQTAEKVIKKPRSNPRTIRVKQYREVPNYIRKNRQVVTFRPKYVNDTTIQYHRRRVEVPKVVYKTLRVTKPNVRQGGRVVEKRTNVEKRIQQFIDEEPNFRPEHYTMDNVRKEAKDIKIPYKAPVQIAKPEVLQVPITLPVKEPYDVVRHVEQRQAMGVPCGHAVNQKLAKTYLPSECPSCQSCQKCGSC
jgi:hypothetical protein